METPAASYQARVRSLAEDYRAQGYEVIVAPLHEQIPDFLVGFRPDLIAHRGDEHIVVEVKPRQALSGNTRVREMARLVQSQPGWNFEFVVLPSPDTGAPEGARPLTRDDVVRGIEESERLLAAGSMEAALLLTWSLIEATLRLVATEEGIPLQRLSPMYVLKQTVSEGVISRQEYDLLTKAMRLRNAWAHGYSMGDLDAAPGIVRGLLDLTRHLLGPQPA